ncbi:MAG: ATP-binding protein [Thiohalomonadaceae bacterium]
MDITDITLHIATSLDHEEQQALEAAMRETDGVIAPRFNKPQLLVVSYNPQQVDAARLLRVVTQRGHEAQLIGM